MAYLGAHRSESSFDASSHETGSPIGKIDIAKTAIIVSMTMQEFAQLKKIKIPGFGGTKFVYFKRLDAEKRVKVFGVLDDVSKGILDKKVRKSRKSKGKGELKRPKDMIECKVFPITGGFSVIEKTIRDSQKTSLMKGGTLNPIAEEGEFDYERSDETVNSAVKSVQKGFGQVLNLVNIPVTPELRYIDVKISSEQKISLVYQILKTKTPGSGLEKVEFRILGAFQKQLNKGIYNADYTFREGSQINNVFPIPNEIIGSLKINTVETLRGYFSSLKTEGIDMSKSAKVLKSFTIKDKSGKISEFYSEIPHVDQLMKNKQEYVLSDGQNGLFEKGHEIIGNNNWGVLIKKSRKSKKGRVQLIIIGRTQGIEGNRVLIQLPVGDNKKKGLKDAVLKKHPKSEITFLK